MKVGDVFKFTITDEIMSELEVQPKDIVGKIKSVYKQLDKKIGYGVVINVDQTYILIQIKRVDKINPTIEDIYNGKTIHVLWTWYDVLYEKEYTILGNIEMEPVEINSFWSIRAKDYDNFFKGKEVEIFIEFVQGGFRSAKTIDTTYDVNVIKELFRYNGLGTSATIILDYLLKYHRDQNNIETLKY
ncbi:hypothetical protein P8V03_09820 [Clostridium sp. A1-XYC3]|uniref:Uncharacterized protein n=1 Tax=Clostridium tanneri TaxID=3037988 RepID=A0ABU4JTL9_9CLOT|nr:hypothetical protein [Clostridium sp. A1-XYC3]MDW8801451.1 hypothetical protein [Clostridium sp. A1-XYC3]